MSKPKQPKAIRAWAIIRPDGTLFGVEPKRTHAIMNCVTRDGETIRRCTVIIDTPKKRRSK